MDLLATDDNGRGQERAALTRHRVSASGCVGVKVRAASPSAWRRSYSSASLGMGNLQQAARERRRSSSVARAGAGGRPRGPAARRVGWAGRGG